MRILSASFLVGVALTISACSPAMAGLINPGFESGDLTGWTPSVIGGFVVAQGDASDGDHYLTSPVEWRGTGGAGHPHWWASSIRQEFPIPVNATTLYLDVRMRGGALTHASAWITREYTVLRDFDLLEYVTEILVLLDLKTAQASSAPNGFTRYTFDISAAAGVADAILTILGTGESETLPPGPVECSIDNVQIVPEPVTLGLLVGGCVVALRRPRRTRQRVLSP